MITENEKEKMVIIRLDNWLYNAGIVGFCNILEESGIKLEIRGEKLIFTSQEEFKEVIENFEEKYFHYLIKKYKKTLSWYKIVSYKEILEKLRKNIDNITEEELDNFNKYIKDTLKYYIKSNSYKAAYEFIESGIVPLEIESTLKTITIKKKENIQDKKEEILDIIDKALILINYCNLPTAKKYLAGKNVIYNLIKNSWDGISFLNPQTKQKNIYKDYKEHFFEVALKYLDEEKEKYKYNCFICDSKIKNFDNNFSFLNNIGFDVSRKSSHIWDFNNDVAMCPICKLIYSCVPAGITYTYKDGIFINENKSLRELLRINRKIYNNIYMEKSEENGKSSLTYKALINALENEEVENLKYELADIQVIRYENEKYYFNILNKKMIKIIEKSKKDLEFISKSWYKDIDTSFKLYEEVVKRILNSQNLYNFIYRILYLKITKNKDCHFSTEQIISVLNINHRILEELNLMENKNIEMTKNAKAAGFYLRKKYKEKRSEDKISGLCYKILNGLKLRNRNTVMNIIFNMYLYVSSPVPSIISEMLKDENSLEQYGYAFVAGLLSENYENKKENEGGEN